MGWVTGIVVYVLTWWVVLFAILPFWVSPRDPGDEYFGTGAPRQAKMGLKVAVTSAVAALVWVGIYVLVKEPWISFRGG
jgi:predicted secreted protein